MTRFVALILLASCARPVPATPPPAVPSPPGPVRCQDGQTVPLAPAAPRTVEQLGTWAMRAERAARQTERARAQCAADYARLRGWINGIR
ncbi:MAG TPA: hypothetical protein VGH36_07875 [Acetobacteraceae bacterium]